MIDQLQTAWWLAASHHAEQRYQTPTVGVSLPYLAHLGGVLLETQQALRHDPTLDAKLAQLCAILHDSLEDTELTEAELARHFGQRVLDGVKALTKNELLGDKPRQMADSLDRILAQPREVAVVKLSDRIANLGPPPAHWAADKTAAYRREAELILTRLGAASPYLATRLRTKIDTYGVG